MNWRRLILGWFLDYDVKTIINSGRSALVTGIFALYNGFLGLFFSSFWHGSICVYYLLLALIRTMIIAAERKAYMNTEGKGGTIRSRTCRISTCFLLIENICMIGPITLLVRLEKPVHMTLTSAIAMAAYAFCKITIAAFHFHKRKKSNDCLVRLLRMINFVDALMSIITLQNTLVMVANTGSRQSVLPLTAVTSGLMWAGSVVLTVYTLVTKGEENGEDRTVRH